MRSDTWFRRALMATGVMNFAGFVAFLPPFPYLRRFAGFPEAENPFYGWLIALWILFFGIAYLRLAVARTLDRTTVGLGAAGKASFFLVLIACGLQGQLPVTTALGGVPDLLFAILFILWLFRGREESYGR